MGLRPTPTEPHHSRVTARHATKTNPVYKLIALLLRAVGSGGRRIDPEDRIVGPQAAVNDLRAVPNAKEVRALGDKSSWIASGHYDCR